MFCPLWLYWINIVKVLHFIEPWTCKQTTTSYMRYDSYQAINMLSFYLDYDTNLSLLQLDIILTTPWYYCYNSLKDTPRFRFIVVKNSHHVPCDYFFSAKDMKSIAPLMKPDMEPRLRYWRPKAHGTLKVFLQMILRLIISISSPIPDECIREVPLCWSKYEGILDSQHITQQLR